MLLIRAAKICNGPEALQLERRLSSQIRAELVSRSRYKMAGELRDYSRIYSAIGFARSLFPGSGGSALSLCSPVSHSVPVEAS